VTGAHGVGQLPERLVTETGTTDVGHDVVEKGLSSHGENCTIWNMNQVVHLERTVSAPPEEVFALLGDVTGWASWSAFDESGLERSGSPVPDGVGAIRRFRYGRTRSREEVTVFDPPHRLGYRLLSGVPAKGYEALVTLTPAPDGGTAITWHSEFRAQWPGTGGLVRRSLTTFIGRLVEDLDAALVRQG
jgi:uncharacterized protein YndB with AHSA1/START domain